MRTLRALWIAALAAPSFGQSFSGGTYASGATPQSVAAGDVNGDAKLDLVTGNTTSTASVLLGTGTGAFGAPALASLPAPAASIALGDVNGDGKLDLAVAPGGFYSDVIVLLGNGAGGFSGATTYTTGLSPNAVRLADVNANGALDLVVGCGDGTIAVRLGTGGGAFGSLASFAAGGPVEALAVADVNGDAKLDVEAALSNGNVAVLLGNGAGAFAAPASFAVGGFTSAIAAGDVSGDGKADLAVSSFLLFSGGASVLLGNGTGGFGAATSLATGGTFVTSLAMASFNGDASLDLAVTQLNPEGAAALFASGGGAFGAPQLVATGSGPTAIAVGDWNGDAKTDFATANGSSDNVTVLVNQLAPPTITGQPSGQTVCSGASAAFTVTASNATGYQWRKGGVNLANGGHYSGVTTPALAINPATGADAASYDCVVSNASGSVTSAAATLTVVNGVPAITTQPVSQSKCVGNSVTFTIAATGAASLQWRKNTVPVGGATLTSFTIASVVAGDAASYDCVATNACGSATSSAATLAVSTGNPSITLQPVSQSKCVGNSVTFTIAATGATSFQWRKNTVPIGGATLTSFTIASVVAGDAASYDCVATNPCGSTTTAAATLAVSTGTPSITLQPVSQAKCVGNSATFMIAASDAASFQWRKNGVPIGGATSSSFTIASVVAGDAASYDCVAANACGSSTSLAATLAVSTGNPSITLQPVSQAKCVGTSATFTIAATGAASFQWRKNGAPIGGATSTAFTIASVVAGDAASYDCVATNPCGSTTSSAATLAVSAGNPSITLQPVNQSKCVGTSATFLIAATDAASFQWRKNGAPIGGATSSSFTIASIVAGDAASYDCVVTNPCGSATSAAATLAVSTGNPTFTQQPASVTTCAGSSASFTIAATGAISFQWRKNAVDIPGATATTFTIASIVAGDAASYDCVATNPCASTTSSAATLAIQTIVFVNKAATGANTGKSWTDAFTDLQSALTSPCVNVEVWVAAATYFPDGGSGNRAATFPLSSAMKVYGGFTGSETLLSQRNPATNVTVLSGDIGLTGNVADNSFHVVTGSGASATALLDGFTIAAGKSDGGNGGGLEIVGGSPRIERCIFNGNSATNGGGLHVSGGAPVLVRCVFQSNAATGSGGAVWDGGSVSLVSCAFRANTAASAGGAIFRDVAAGTTSVVNAAMTGNTAPSGGAILSNGSLSLSSCSFALNMATGAGGGIRTTGALTATNSILYFNGDAAGQVESSQVSVGGGTASVNFCDVQGLTGGLGGAGNLGGDPKFADANGLDDLAGTADDDLRLRPGSPCIDAGSNALLALDTADLDGDANLAEALPLDLHEHLRQIEDPFTANTGAGAAPFADLGALEECVCEGVPYGTGTPGCNGVQQLGLNQPAKINSPAFAFTCAKSPASALGLGMVTDVADFNGTDLFGIGAKLHVDLVFSTLVVTLDCASDPLGSGLCPAPIPNTPTFVGVSLYMQALWVWSSCALPPFQISTSEGIRFTFLP